MDTEILDQSFCDGGLLCSDEYGEFAADAIEALRPGPDDASVFQDYIEHHLMRIGFSVEREVSCLKVSGRRGRIDLVASYGAARIGIELDWLQPRCSSLAKLRNFIGYRLIVLRRTDRYGCHPCGIDRIVCLPVVEPLQPFLAGQSARFQ